MKKIIVLILLISQPVFAGWEVDFSRRKEQMTKPQDLQMQETQVVKKAEEKTLFERVFDTVVPTQELVIINTEQGFIPATVRVKEGVQYRVVVVNVNEKARNVSFVLDAFSEHHSTYYGQVKSFYISPKKEGVYSFISPETSAQGRLVVHPSTTGNSSNTELRAPAAE